MRLIAICVGILMAVPAASEKLPLSALSAYFNAMTTAEGTFQQINNDGSVSTGEILIKRPGRMRFEYDPPDTALVLAANRAVYILDKKSNQPPETYPLRRTPLWIILQRDVDLAAAKMVVGHDFDETSTIVTAQDPENPELGTIRMYFTAGPIALRQWVITDEYGNDTTVVLGPLKTGGRITNSNFNIDQLIEETR